MNSPESTNGFPASRLGRGMAALAHDATTIAELQARLVALDLKDGSKSLRNAVLLAVIGGALLLACLPVGMLALGELLVDLAGWETWVAYLVTGGGGLLIGLLLLWIGWLAVRKAAATFQRSREELARNVEWFKEALRPDRR
jgi:hypothetical protein